MVNKKKARKQKRQQQQAAASTATTSAASPAGNTSRPSAIGVTPRTSTADLRRRLMMQYNPFTATTKEELDAIKSPHVVSSDENDPVPAPSGTTCWICLEGPDDAEHDEEPEPLRRDCACRGSSSGYAHLSCLASYATSRSEEIWTGRRKAAENTNQLAFGVPWESCPNCKQFFTGKLQLDLAREYARSTEGMVHGLRAFRHIVARSWVTKALNTGFVTSTESNVLISGVSYEDVETEFDNLLELIESVRSRGIYNGQNPIMEYMRHHLLQMESETNTNYASIVNQRAQVLFTGKMDTDTTRAYEKSCALYTKAISQAEALKGTSIFDGGGTQAEAESSIMHMKSSLANMKNYWRKKTQVVEEEDTFDRKEDKDVVDLSEKALKMKIEERRGGFSDVVSLAVAHVNNLLAARRPFEALDLLEETLGNSRRALGPDHVETKTVVNRLELFKQFEYGAYYKDPMRQYYKVDRYDEDLNLYVMDVKETLKDGPAIAWAPSELILKPFALVKCVELKGSTHLNGKRGYVSDYDDSNGRHAIEFEDRSLKSCLVKPANLRLILVDRYINSY